MLNAEYDRQLTKQEALITKKSTPEDFYNDIYTRWCNPVLTRNHIPLIWKYDLDEETNPFFMERLEINSTINPGAIQLNGKFYLVARIEGCDRKSFFAWRKAIRLWTVFGFGIIQFNCPILVRVRWTYMTCV